MTEYLMVFPDRDSAEEVADQLSDEEFASVRVVAEALAGEDDAEDVDWVVHVVHDAADDPATDQEMVQRFTALAEDYDGWLDEDAGD